MAARAGAASPPPPVLLEGWLSKQSVSAPAWAKNWRRRYCVLHPVGSDALVGCGRITWHRERGGEVLGELLLAPDSTLRSDEGNRFTLFSFGSELSAEAEDALSAAAWKAAIEQALRPPAQSAGFAAARRATAAAAAAANNGTEAAPAPAPPGAVPPSPPASPPPVSPPPTDDGSPQAATAAADDADADADAGTDELPDAFVALAEAMPYAARRLLVDREPPEAVCLDELLDALGLERRYAEHSYSDLPSLRLLRLARGLPAEPPLTAASSRDVLRKPGALSPAACATLRELADREASTAADSVDGAPDFQVDVAGAAALERIIGKADAASLWRLVRAFREQAGVGAAASKTAGGEGEGEGHWADVVPSEIFVRRYSASTRPWNPFHCDRAACTVNVALCDDGGFEGGRLLALLDGRVQVIERRAGEATVHSSKLVHGVSRMGEGVRYSLICFFSSCT